MLFLRDVKSLLTYFISLFIAILYYYINFCVIEHEDERNNSTIILPPSLRDVEWLFFYNWFICRGFSGFQNDYEVVQEPELTNIQNGNSEWIDAYSENLFNK
jgi:hypothetical protein